MPPKIKVSREQILQSAIEIIQANGIECLNARELAKKLGCSVQPIFREFNSMEGLKTELYKAVEDIYNTKMLLSMNNNNNGFFSMGQVYISFAIENTNLFKMLFMSNIFQSRNISEIAGTTEGDDEVLDILCKATGLNRKYAQELYTGVWITTHGLASLYATNSCNFNQQEVQRILSDCYTGLLSVLKEKEKQLK